MTTRPPNDSLLSPIFESPAMAARFADAALLQAMLDVEAALASAEAACGVIPESAVESISQACAAGLYDIGEIGRAAALAGNPAIPLVKALSAKVDGDAARYVHWGATSQDIIDTALMLLMRDGLAEIRDDLADAIGTLVGLADTHRGTAMVGRTWMQQALPITLGFKASVWMSGLVSARRTVRALSRDCLALQFAGASGTLASLGSDGPTVRAALAERLGLAIPPIAWHAERSRVARIGTDLALVSGSAAKIATDILLMMQTEVAEAFEPAAAGKGGSSTMPHKRNPVACAAIRANHRRITGLVTPLLLAMEAEHERAPGAWSAEWEPLRDLFRLTGGSVVALGGTLAGLEIDTGRMAANLAANGLPMAESLMMALAPHVGRTEAHHVVETVSRQALAEGADLQSVARKTAGVTAHLSDEAIAAALDPASYLGMADDMIDAAITVANEELEQA